MPLNYITALQLSIFFHSYGPMALNIWIWNIKYFPTFFHLSKKSKGLLLSRQTPDIDCDPDTRASPGLNSLLVASTPLLIFCHFALSVLAQTADRSTQ